MWWVRTDCCGVFCALFTVALMFYAAVVQTLYVLGPWKGYMSAPTILYLLLVLIAAIAHTRCQLTNPGSVPLEGNDIDLEVSPTDEVPYCRHCKRYKPSRAHHCRTCEHCIVRMDHHCPWVNNCVAIFNQKYFLQFLVYTGMQCLVCLVSISSRFFRCQSYPSPGTRRYREIIAQDANYSIPQFCQTSPLDIVLCILNFIEGILFGLFTFIMLYDQLCAIFANTPYIDSLKGKKGQKKKRYECLKDVFGEPFSIGWFIPSPPTPTMRHNFKIMCATFRS